MGFFASLFGCGTRPDQSAPAVPTADVHIIDYAHESGGLFYHGTVSLIRGKVGATWTVGDRSDKKSRDIAISEATFKSIWDSLNEIGDFKTGLVTRPDQQLDPRTFHVVGVVYGDEGRKKIRTYLIPVETASSAFKEWLSKLGYAGQ